MIPHVGRRRRCDSGQAAVEAALVAPFAVLLALVVVQVGVLVHQQVLVTAAAREAVRAAAVSPPGDAGTRAAGAIGGLDRSRLDLTVDRPTGEGALVRVRARYHAPTDVPLIGPLLPDVDVGAEAVMRSET